MQTLVFEELASRNTILRAPSNYVCNQIGWHLFQPAYPTFLKYEAQVLGPCGFIQFPIDLWLLTCVVISSDFTLPPILQQLAPMLKVPSTPFPWITNGQISSAFPKRGYKCKSLDSSFLRSSAPHFCCCTPGHLHDRLSTFLYRNNSTNTDEWVDNRGESQGLGAILERLAERASRYSINLDEFTFKDDAPWFRGGFSLIWPGTLQLQKAKAKGLAKNGFLGDGETAKVNLLHSRNTLPYREPRLL